MPRMPGQDLPGVKSRSKKDQRLIFSSTMIPCLPWLDVVKRCNPAIPKCFMICPCRTPWILEDLKDFPYPSVLHLVRSACHSEFSFLKLLMYAVGDYHCVIVHYGIHFSEHPHSSYMLSPSLSETSNVACFFKQLVRFLSAAQAPTPSTCPLCKLPPYVYSIVD